MKQVSVINQAELFPIMDLSLAKRELNVLAEISRLLIRDIKMVKPPFIIFFSSFSFFINVKRLRFIFT